MNWYNNEVVPENLYEDLRAEGKNDDALFKRFILDKYPSVHCLNFIPNIVDHVDYLLGGSVINKQREGTRRAYWFEEPKVVKDLEESLNK